MAVRANLIAIERNVLPLMEDSRSIQFAQERSAQLALSLVVTNPQTCEVYGQLKNRWSWLSLLVKKLHKEVDLVPNNTNLSSV